MSKYLFTTITKSHFNFCKGKISDSERGSFYSIPDTKPIPFLIFYKFTPILLGVTKLELSEHHYYRTVGSDSFFIAAERIGLPYKSQANQFVLIAPQSIYGDYLLKKQTTFLMSTTATEHTIFVYHSK